MANPAVEFTVIPPAAVVLPVQITLAAKGPRLYFDLPSEAGPHGPVKEITYTGGEPPTASIAVFPARKKHNEDSIMAVLFVDARGRKLQLAVTLHIVAVETHDASPAYPILVDFSQDKTGFYRDASHRAAFQQAVDDWAFFLADRKIEPVPARKERTWIFEPEGFTKGHLVSNANEYRGYLLYTYGIHGPELRSGGEPSQAGGWQVEEGQKLSIRRSGGVEVETRGNYNTRGWSPPTPDEQWFRATNLQDTQNDLYSIVHHEMGHALFFHPATRKFPRNGVPRDDAVRAYLGSDPQTDVHDHFDGITDPWSLHGAFGNEYHGKTPYGRWLITRFDLLCAQAVGYRLRNVAALRPLAIRTEQLPGALQGTPYKQSIAVEGGFPVYDWGIAAGTLPRGLLLNRFTGQFSGAPQQVGAFRFTIEVKDYQQNSPGVSREFQIDVARR